MADIGNQADKAATLKDVAQAAGVSVNTASRAMRDMDDISQETKERVRSAADSLGYRKNLAAVRLKTNESKQIGVIVSDIANPFFGSMLKGVERACASLGYGIMVKNSNATPKEEEQCVRMFADCGVDGVMFVPCSRNRNDTHRLLSLLEKLRMPFIVAAARYPDAETSFVMSNDMLGGYLAAEHLFKLGHRKFGMLFQPFNTSPVKDRIEGFSRFLREKGLDTNECLRFAKWSTEELDADAPARNLINNEKDITAVFTYCDYFATYIYAAIYEAGLRIPQDISVVGYDNIQVSRCLWPPLTTVNINDEMLGEVAGHELIELLHQRSDIKMQRQVVLEPYLVVRSSTCAPKAR